MSNCNDYYGEDKCITMEQHLEKLKTNPNYGTGCIKGRMSLTAEQNTTNPKDLIGIKKPPLDLVPPTGIIHEAMAFGNGADKYGAYNFRDKKVQAMIYIGATLRHIYSYIDREDYAADSGVHHLGHARACLNILLDAEENGFLIDNRPKKGKTSHLIERLTVK